MSFVFEFSSSCENCNVKFSSEFEQYIHLCDYCMQCGEYNCLPHCINCNDEFDYMMEKWENCSVCKGTGRIPVMGTLCDRCCEDVSCDDEHNYDDLYDDFEPDYGDGCCYCSGIGDCENCGMNRRDDWW